MVKFVYNNAPFTLIGLSPFFVNYGYHPLAHNPLAVPRARNLLTVGLSAAVAFTTKSLSYFV